MSSSYILFVSLCQKRFTGNRAPDCQIGWASGVALWRQVCFLAECVGSREVAAEITTRPCALFGAVKRRDGRSLSWDSGLNTNESWQIFCHHLHCPFPSSPRVQNRVYPSACCTSRSSPLPCTLFLRLPESGKSARCTLTTRSLSKSGQITSRARLFGVLSTF